MNNGQKTLESMSQANWYNKWTLDKFKQYLNGDILEVGCGIGNFTKSLIKYGKVWAIDIDKKYIDETKESVDEKALVGVGDIEKGKYFFNGQKFDTIICINVLEHIQDDASALKNLYTLLKEGGYLVLLVPAHQFLFGEIDKSIGHFRRYDKSWLINIINSVGFKIVKTRVLNMFGAIGWWFASKVLSDSKVSGSKIQLFNLIAPFLLPIENIAEPPFGTSILIISQKPK